MPTERPEDKATDPENWKMAAMAPDATPMSLGVSETVPDWVIAWKLTRKTMQRLLVLPLPGP